MKLYGYTYLAWKTLRQQNCTSWMFCVSKLTVSYCSRIYSSSNPDLQDKSIFLLLLKIYLLPQNKDKLLLAPALSLLANHSTQLDPAAVLEILPPLVTMEEIRSFLIRTMRDGTRRINDRKIIKSIVSSRKEEVERILMGLEVKRVRITDQRM